MSKGANEAFLDRMSPNRTRTRTIPWPLDPDSGETIEIRYLGDDEREAAYFAARDHFDSMKVKRGEKLVTRKVDTKDPAFENRERVELVWRAYSRNGEKLTQSAARLARRPGEVIDALYFAWAQYQREAAALPPTAGRITELAEALKKNSLAVPLVGLPSSWLIALITTLADPSSSSTTTSESGS